MQSLADLGEMSAGIAHEFRNSLSVVLGYLRLARKAGPPAPVDETITRAENEARELSVAVDSLLTFTRPMELQLHPLELSELVESIAGRLRVLDERVTVTVVTTPVTVTADAALLSRVVENLIRNAFDAVREKGPEAHIDIRVTAGPPTITVTDNGVGLEAGQASRLFVPFQSTKPSGFGLGLAMAQKIVLFHGGVITLENGPAGGAVATVRLPPSDAG
jgi:signal transduction histidine kinase